MNDPRAKLLFGTFNRGKLDEFGTILEGCGLSVRLLAPPDVGITAEPEETGATFAENAREKAIYFSKQFDGLVIAEDSGLYVDALGGWPGVQSKRVADSDPERISILLAKLEGVAEESRTARFICSAAVALKEEVLFTAECRTEGLIAPERAGEGGFGYDPVFFYPPAAMTFAQMTAKRKSEVSHRGKALRAVCGWLKRSGALC
ncbi:MAG: RdgB/HAM1 family non-canonical purine NTP pyrophosphatase [bacterium]|jgi:XTP/dITP diphosphohydrolase